MSDAYTLDACSPLDTVKIYIPNDELAWVKAEIIRETDCGVCEVRITDELYIRALHIDRESKDGIKQLTTNVNMKQLEQRYSTVPLQILDLPPSGVADMCNLNYLHEASIIENLERRFSHQLPYTNSGNICISVNPYQWQDLYSDHLKEQYVTMPAQSLAPHPYAISSNAYRSMKDFGKLQSILVSGESGSGKTETVKILMDHIAFISGEKSNTTIQKVLQSNPLLESFGNAKTSRNDNSSRFGKFIQLQFDENSRLAGSRCFTYLLEKSRIVGHGKLEKNYHIFYQMFSSPETFRKELYLQNRSCQDFNYTVYEEESSSAPVELENNYDTTTHAMHLIGISPETQRYLFRILAGLLYLGLLQFGGDQDVSELDLKCTNELNICSELFGLSKSDLLTNLTTRTINAAGAERVVVPLSRESALETRDALAKDVYHRLFHCLVWKINESTALSDDFSHHTISLLDIFGFEKFVDNRFEQLCINYANERLQLKFSQDVILSVQLEYQQEGLGDDIDWKFPAATQLEETLELLDGRTGIWALLNEECKVPQGSNSKLLRKIVTSSSKNPSFSTSVRLNKEEFTVKHFAGTVDYNIDGFLERNKDNLIGDLRTMMLRSNNPFIGEIFAPTEVDVVNEFSGNATNSLTPTSTPSLTPLSTPNSKIEVSTPSSTRGSISSLSTLWKSPEKLDTSFQEDMDGEFHTPDRLSSSASITTPNSSLSRSVHRKFSTSHRRRQSFVAVGTVVTKFRSQLNHLLEVIGQSDVQYIRCIKPNALKSSQAFDRKMISDQIRYAGIVEAIRISRSTFPYRMLHNEFLRYYDLHRKFPVLRPETTKKTLKLSLHHHHSHHHQQHLKSHHDDHHSNIPEVSSSDIVSKFLETLPFTLNSHGIAVGKCRIFYDSTTYHALEAYRRQILSQSSIVLQTVARVLLAKRIRAYRLKMIISIQSRYRSYLYRRIYCAIRRFIIIQQKYIRRFLAIRSYKKCRLDHKAILIQSNFRCYEAKKLFSSQKRAAVRIESLIRMRLCRKKFLPIWQRHLDSKNLMRLTAQWQEERNLRVQAESRLHEVETELIRLKEILEIKIAQADQSTQTISYVVDHRHVQTELSVDHQAVQTNISTNSYSSQTETSNDHQSVQTETSNDHQSVQTESFNDHQSVQTETFNDHQSVQTETDSCSTMTDNGNSSCVCLEGKSEGFILRNSKEKASQTVNSHEECSESSWNETKYTSTEENRNIKNTKDGTNDDYDEHASKKCIGVSNSNNREKVETEEIPERIKSSECAMPQENTSCRIGEPSRPIHSSYKRYFNGFDTPFASFSHFSPTSPLFSLASSPLVAVSSAISQERKLMLPPSIAPLSKSFEEEIAELQRRNNVWRQKFLVEKFRRRERIKEFCDRMEKLSLDNDLKDQVLDSFMQCVDAEASKDVNKPIVSTVYNTILDDIDEIDLGDEGKENLDDAEEELDILDNVDIDVIGLGIDMGGSSDDILDEDDGDIIDYFDENGEDLGTASSHPSSEDRDNTNNVRALEESRFFQWVSSLF